MTLNEVWQEELVRDQLQPGKCKSWIIVWIEILEQISHVKENLSLSLWIEEFTDRDSAQNIHQHPIVWHLVEVFLLLEVIIVKSLPDNFEDALHKLQLPEGPVQL